MADKTCINCIDYKHCLVRMNLIFINNDDKGLKELYKYIGEATNNNAEYNALIYALEEASGLGIEEVIISLDSELVVKQLNGEYKVKSVDIKPLFEKAVEALKKFKSFDIRHIDRSKNKEADKLVNKAINLAGLSL